MKFFKKIKIICIKAGFAAQNQKKKGQPVKLPLFCIKIAF